MAGWCRGEGCSDRVRNLSFVVPGLSSEWWTFFFLMRRFEAFFFCDFPWFGMIHAVYLAWRTELVYMSSRM